MSTPRLSLLIQDSSPVDHRLALGEKGENLASEFLIDNGFRMIAANFKVPVGRNSRGVQVTGEIDIIALDQDTLCFVEVKTRRSEDFVPVTANVDLRKQRQIIRTAKIYRRIFDHRNIDYRYDVVSVLIPKHSDPEIKLIKGFWSESKFKKKTWEDRTWDEYS